MAIPPPDSSDAPGAQVVEIDVTALTIGDDFRIDDDPDALAGLAASIGELGVLQALIVRQTADGWEVIAGRRRLAAARTAGLRTVPCVLRSCDDGKADEIALAENLHRRRLSPIEEAIGYERLRGRGMTQLAIGQQVGRSDAHVCNLLKLLRLPGDLRDRIHRGNLKYTTVLEHWDEYIAHGKLSGGGKGKGRRPAGQDESAIISHWRRRHDRLIAGIQAILHAKNISDFQVVLDKLLKLDAQPLDEPPIDPASEKYDFRVWPKGRRSK